MPGETRRKTILVGGFIIWSAILWMLSYIVYTHGFLANDLPNTDMVIELDYARYVYETKSFFPKDFVFTTETRPFLPAFLTAVFYGIFENLRIAFVTSLAFNALVGSVLVYLLFRNLDCNKMWSFLGMLFFGAMYHVQVFSFDFISNFYVEFYLCCLLTLLGFFTLRKGWQYASFLAAFVMGLHSLRALALLYLPLFLVVLLFSYYKGRRTCFASRCCFLGMGIFFQVVGYAFLKNVLVPLYHLQFQTPEIMFFPLPPQTVWWDSLREIGNALDVFPLYPDAIPFGIFWLVVAMIFFFTMQYRRAYSWRQAELLTFCFISGAAAWLASVFCHAPSERYYTSICWLVIFIIVFGFCWLGREGGCKSIFLAGAFFVFGVCSFPAMWMRAYQPDWNQESPYAAVVRVLQRENVSYAYAPYWEAGPMEARSDFSIRFGFLRSARDLKAGESYTLDPYIWGTSRRLYEPDTAPQHVAVILDEKAYAALSVRSREILAQGTFCGKAGQYRVWLFEENPILFGVAFS